MGRQIQNVFFAPEPNVLSIERDWGTDSNKQFCTSMDLAIGNFELSFYPPIVSDAVSNCGESAHNSNGSRSFVAADNL